MQKPQLRIATFNLEHNGGSRRDEALAMLASLDLDALLMQELADDEAQLVDTEKTLGMRGTIAGGNRGKLHTGIFLREETFPGFRPFRAEKLGRIRPTDVTTYLPERPDIPITFVSVHLSYNSPIDRLREAYALVPVADKAQAGQPVFVGGDWNELPTPVFANDGLDVMDWEFVTDRVHRAYRARHRPDGIWETITDVDDLLHEMGMRDAARYVHGHYAKHDTLAPTCGHTRPDQGDPVRLDRILVPEWMIDAIIDIEVTDTGFSDHHLVTVTLSRPQLIELLKEQSA